MIIVKMMGGLGNQMFQIAFAKMLCLELDEEIYLDCSAYEKYKIRSFSVSNLNVGNRVKYIDDLNVSSTKKIYLKVSQKVYHVWQKIRIKSLLMKNYRIGKNPYKILASIGLYYNFDNYYYDVLENNTEIKCLYGYFQSEKYFKKYKNEICNDLKVKIEPNDREKKLLDEIKGCNAIGISMRLGDDYTKSSILNVCNEDFYYRAMDYIYSKNKDAVFYIFSDCIEIAKEKFEFKYPVRYVDGFKDYESLRLLYSCKHFIISNSSFAWWGAYLCDNQKKIIIAPSKWYNDGNEQPDIYWEGMTLLDV